MTDNQHLSQLVPTPLCRTFAALLPVLDEPEIDPQAAAEARTHVATCAYCQNQLATYDHLEAALRRHLGPAGTPRQYTGQIMRNLLNSRSVEEGNVHSSSLPPSQPGPRRPGRSHRLVSGLASLAAVLVIVLLIAALLVNRANQGQSTGPQKGNTPTIATTLSPTSNPNQPQSTDTEFNSISMVSPTEGWAVGISAFPDHETALLMHYHNGVWSEYPNSFDEQLTSVSMVSATDGWAISSAHLLHYDGKRWTVVSALVSGCPAPSIQMLSATDGWRTGCISASTGTRGALFHFDGQTWTYQQLPTGLDPNLYFFGLSMISSTEGWVVGYFDTSSGSADPRCLSANSEILHFKDGQWTVQSRFTDIQIGSISMASANDGWATGSKTDTCSNGITSGPPVLVHYTQGQWKQVAPPLSGSQTTGFYLVSMASAGDVWMATSVDLPYIRQLLHWNGAAWSMTPPLPTISDTAGLAISSIATTAAGDAWAVGGRVSGSEEGIPTAGGGFQPRTFPLILHAVNGVWKVVKST